MYHKELLSGPFKIRARRSPCVQTPLCPARLRGPGHPGLQPQSTPVRGNHNTCAGARPAGRGWGVGTTRPSLSWASWPPAVDSQSTVSGTNGVFRRSRKSGGAGQEPHPGPMANAHSSPKVHRGHLARQCCSFAVPLAPGRAGPKHNQRSGCWVGRYSPLWAAQILRTSIQGTRGARRSPSPVY